MGAKTKTAAIEKPPIASMIDVVFLLLIYFVATQKPQIPEAHLSVNLPSDIVQPKPLVEKVLPIDISVHSNEYFLMGQPQPLQNIAQTLEDVANTNKKSTILIKTAVEAKHKRLVDVLDLCEKNELESLNLVTLR